MKRLLLIVLPLLLIVGCVLKLKHGHIGPDKNESKSSGMCINADSTPELVYCWAGYDDELSCVLNNGNENLIWVDDMDEDDCDEFQGGP